MRVFHRSLVLAVVVLATVLGGCAIGGSAPEPPPTTRAPGTTATTTAEPEGQDSRGVDTTGSPVIGIDLTEGADRPTLLTDAEETIAKACPTPHCVTLKVVVDRSLDDDESQACEVREIRHPHPLRTGDRVTITINRPCGEDAPLTTPRTETPTTAPPGT